MTKSTLSNDQATLESQLIETLLAGLHDYRPDLHYPESHSDMQACVRGLMRMFEIERRPLVVPLKVKCHRCEGVGELITKSNDQGTYRESERCTLCRGRGYIHE
jgi:hypothetical protein